MPALEEMATLALNIDTSKVSEGVSRLDDLSHAARRAETATDQWNRSTNKAVQEMNSLSSKLKAVAGHVLGLAAAYVSLSKAMEMTREGFAYNEQLENAQLGIAAVIASTLKLEDAQGRVLEGQEKFTAAQGMSVKMAKALDVASMESPAGYTELLTTFQRLLAPSAQLGLQWKDTLDITIKMSNVLSALGLDMEKLGRETESILTGKNINLSQVAQRLGISKEEIQSWGRGEELMKNFLKRFEQFKYAGVAVENTMSAVRAYYEDVLQNIAGEANTALWDKMKESMLIVADAFYEIDEASNQFKIRDEIQPLVDLWNAVGEAIGQNVVDAVTAMMSKIKEFGDYVGGKGLNVFFDDLARSAKLAGAAILSIIVARKAMTATFTVGAGATATEVTGLRTYIAAVQQRIVADRELAVQNTVRAQSEHQAALAALNNYRATLQTKLAEADAIGSKAKRIALLSQEKVLVDALTASQTRLAAATAQVAMATKATAASAIKLSAFTAAATGLRAAGASLLAMFGGPWGLALTGAVVGLTYLATKEDEAATATKLHTEAQEAYQASVKNATDETGNLTRKLTEIEKINLDRALEKQEGAVNKAVDRMKQDLAGLLDSMQEHNLLNETDSWGVTAMLEKNFAVPEEYVQRFQSIIEMFRKSPQDVEPFLVELKQLYDDLKAAGVGTKDTQDRIAELIDQAMNSKDGLQVLVAGLKQIQGAASQAAAALDTARIAAENAGGVSIKGLDALAQRAEADKYIAGQKGRSKSQASWLLNSAKLPLPVVSAIQTKNDWSGVAEKDREALKTAYGNVGDAYDLSQTGKGGGGSKSSDKSLKTAQENIHKLKEEIAQLNGEATKASTDFDKKIRDIQRIGEEAKLTGPQIAELKEEYRRAFETKALKDFDKEMLTVKGDTSALRQIEIEDKIKAWEDRFKAAGLSAEEATQKINDMKSALEKEQNYKDLQTASQFLRELTSMGVAYGLSLEVQNQLIEHQAEIYRQTLPDSLKPYIEMWKELQKLQIARDPWSGIQRGTLKFVAENTDYAKKMEEIWSNALDGIGDRFADLCLKGEANFEELASSIIEDLERMILKAIEAQAFSGIMNLIGGAVSGWLGGSSSTYSAAQVSTMESNGMRFSGGGTSGPLNGVHGHAKGGAFVGGNLSSFSGSIVSSPTLFSYGTKAFAYGAGLMGEAGPEAIMPLTRGSDGRLGVRTYGDSGYGINQQQQPQIVYVNIHNHSGKEATQESRTDNQGNKTIDVIIGDAAAQQAMKPGSNLNKALRTITGTQQQITRR